MAEVENDEKPKPGIIKSIVLPLVLVSLIAVATGWFISTQTTINVKIGSNQTTKKESNDAGHEDALISEGGEILELETILAELRADEKTWIKLDIAIVPNVDVSLTSAKIQSKIRSDIIALIKTLRLSQITGPSGLLHFKEDLLDRVRLTTNGQVKDIMILSFIAE